MARTPKKTWEADLIPRWLDMDMEKDPALRLAKEENFDHRMGEYEDWQALKKARIPDWLSGQALHDVLTQHYFSIFDFGKAVLNGELSLYDKAGLKILNAPFSLFQQHPPGCRYEDLESKDAYDLIYTDGYFYKGEDVKKLIGIKESPAKAVLLDGNTIIRKTHALTHANAVKRAYPNITAKEAAKEINAHLAAENLTGYSEKHLMIIIKPLGFKLGKPGAPLKK